MPTTSNIPPKEMSVCLTREASTDLMAAIFGLHVDQGASIVLDFDLPQNGVMKANVAINGDLTPHFVEFRGDGTWSVRSTICNPNVEG